MMRIPLEFDPISDATPQSNGVIRFTTKHHINIEMALPFWDKFPIAVDCYFVRQASFDNIVPPSMEEMESDELPLSTGLLPFSYNRAYGLGDHLTGIDEVRQRSSLPYFRGVEAAEMGKENNDNPYQPGLAFEEHREWLEGHTDATRLRGIDPNDYCYFGSITEKWHLLITVPENIVRVPGNTFAALIVPCSPWGTLQDEMEGKIKLNPDYDSEEIYYADVDEGEESVHQQIDEKRELPLAAMAFIHHHVGEVMDRALSFPNLEWQHPEVQKAFEDYCGEKMKKLQFGLL